MRAFRNHITNRFNDLRHRQDGGVMIEVILSTLLVAIVSAGVLEGVSGSVKTAVQNRERSVAASLAEQDQERMRSFKATSLDGYSQTRTVTVRGINYTVQSSTQWVFDSSGTKSCTSDTSQASYLKLMTTVTPIQGQPVSATSLLTPPNGTFSDDKGSLAVMVVDRNGAPRPNLTVNLTGGSVSESDATNDAGCSNFYYVPTGNYTVTVAASGLVDRSGSPSPTLTAGVVGGQSTLATVELDVPVTVNVNFDTQQGTAAAVAAPSQYARIASSGLASPGYLQGSLGTFPSTNNTFTWTSLYPFTSGFAVYGGNCDRNSPAFWQPTYTANAFNVTPGGTSTRTARLPALWTRVQRNGVNLNGADVRVTPTATGCTSTTFPLQQTNSSGALPKPGYPWGTYSVCADDSVSNPGTVRRATVTMNNTTSVTGGGTAQTTININTTSSPTGNC